ncbi:MATE family efflux transporter [Hellea balneolensis]|uniref:MATE family efflux transporter n=1 Tax=Hellea balneolensis TaxID=287478 RepID=UPI0005533188|nr:MATE family efflux transporter [Hellea balneolensis]
MSSAGGAAGGLVLSRKNIFSQSWPIMLANAAAPIVGLVDTFVIGRFATTTALAGIGLGAVIYAIAYWGFGFLRMSTAGLAAQSDGAQNEGGVQAHLARAVPLGFFIGLFIFSAQIPLLAGAFKVFTGTPDVESAAATYIGARLWGLPATLASIALMGWFVGISRSGLALKMQIVLNFINIILSPLFVIQFGWGLWGVGIASALAEWGGLAAGLYLAFSAIKQRGGLQRKALSKSALLDPSALRKLGITNSNIFIRTLCLTLGFSFFGNAAAAEGVIFLAGYHILMQFITMVALVLDAFAHTAEAVTGAAYGAKNRARFDKAVKLTTEFSAIFAVMIGALIFFGGPFFISMLSKDPDVIASATRYLPYCALAPIVGFAAWQLDGIFIGTTHTREMRNAGIAAVAIYIAAHHLFTPKFDKDGIWIAFLTYYIARAVTLCLYVPKIRKQMDDENGY